jgi:hypothetical protein
MERASGKQPRKKVPPEAAADGHAAAKRLPYGDGRAPAWARHRSPAPREHGIAQARIRPVPSANLLTIASLSFFRAPTLIPRERHRHRRTRVQVVRPRRLCRVARCTFV